MEFQLFIRFNDKRDTVLDVANSSEEFDKTTIRKVKEKFERVDPETPGRLNINLPRDKTNRAFFFCWHFRTRFKLQSNFIAIICS